jgi:HD-GYP domain-containing protein (c-di-GMP phosphodiesterase class II)
MTTASLKRADFLAACQARQQSNETLEEIRDKGAEVVMAMFRLAKNSLVHALDNEAMLKTAVDTTRITTDFAVAVGGQVSVTFVDQTIFVCGQLLRASRSVYESAMELGRLLERCGVSEISFTGDVQQSDLLTFAQAFSVSARDPQQRGVLLEAQIPNMEVRKVDISLQQADEDGDLPDMERILNAYASAMMVMRRYFDKTAQGKTTMPHQVKRIAQRVVSLARTNESSLLALIAVANKHRDDEGRAVLTAILAVLIARKLTNSRVALGQVAMTALMADIGRVRIAGKAGRDQLIQLSDEAESAIPMLTSSICISTGGVNIQNAARTVSAFETTFIERENLLGPLYKRTMSPMVQSKILQVVRAYLDRIAPRDTSRPMSPVDALAAVSQIPNLDNVAYKLLVSSVGLMPTGTVVEFETGEWGIVVGPSANQKAHDKPRIKLVTDKSGRVFAKPKEIDLGDESKGGRFPKIKGVVDPGRARFNVAGVLMKAGGATMATMAKSVGMR